MRIKIKLGFLLIVLCMFGTSMMPFINANIPYTKYEDGINEGSKFTEVEEILTSDLSLQSDENVDFSLNWTTPNSVYINDSMINYRLDNSYRLTFKVHKAIKNDPTNYHVRLSIKSLIQNEHFIEFDNQGVEEFDWYSYQTSYTIDFSFNFESKFRTNSLPLQVTIELDPINNKNLQKQTINRVIVERNPLLLYNNLNVIFNHTINDVEQEIAWSLNSTDNFIVFAKWFNLLSDQVEKNHEFYTPSFGKCYLPLNCKDQNLILLLRGMKKASNGGYFTPWEYYSRPFYITHIVDDLSDSTIETNNSTSNIETIKTQDTGDVGIAGLASIYIYVYDENGAATEGAKVDLYTEGYATYIGTRYSASNGHVYFGGLNAGNYVFEVYFNGFGSTSIQGFWGGGSITVSSDTSIVTRYFNREWFYTSSISVPNSPRIGDMLTFTVRVKSLHSYSQSVRVQLVVSRDMTTDVSTEISGLQIISPSSYIDYTFQIDSSSWLEGRYYVRAVVEAYPGYYLVTDETDWLENFYLNANEGNLRITVFNENNVAKSNANVKLYKNDWTFVANGYTDSAGQIYFYNLPVDDLYRFEVYDGGEFWGGEKDIGISYALTTYEQFYRDMPFVESLSYSPTDPMVEETIGITIRVENKGTGKNIYANIYFSNDGGSTISYTRNGYITYCGSYVYISENIPTSGWSPGTYHIKVKVYSDVGSYVLTDETGWTWSFYLKSDKSDLEITVKNYDGSVQPGAVILLFRKDETTHFAEETTDGYGKATFDDLNKGDYYYFDVYYNEYGGNIYGESWGRKTDFVILDQSINYVVFNRNNPYIDSLILNPDPVMIGNQFTVTVSTRNPDSALNSYVKVFLSKDGGLNEFTSKQSITKYSYSTQSYSITFDTSETGIQWTTGTYHIRIELWEYPGAWDQVDETGWDYTIYVRSDDTDLEVTIKNEKGELAAGVYVVLYHDGALLTTKVTDGSGKTTFENLKIGDTYSYEVYFDEYGGEPKEFWGASGNIVIPDQQPTTTHIFQRSMPYLNLDSLQITFDEYPVLWDYLNFQVDVLNPSIPMADVYICVSISKDGGSTLFLSKLSTKQLLSGVGTFTVRFYTNPYQGWEIGEYHYRIDVYPDEGITTQITDETGWLGTFEIEYNRGHLYIKVENDLGESIEGAKIILYNNDDWSESWGPYFTKKGGYVYLTNLNASKDYRYEVYFNDVFWGGKQDIDIVKDQIYQSTFTRDKPYLYSMAFDPEIVRGQIAEFELTIRNPSDFDVLCNIFVNISVDGTTTYATASLENVLIGSDNNIVIIDFTDTTQWDIQTYLVSVKIKTWLDPKWATTDLTNWDYNFDFIEDTFDPTNPTSFVCTPEVGYGAIDGTITISWSGASDIGMGVSCYSYILTRDPWEDPGYNDNGAEETVTFTGLDSGTYYFMIRTRDSAGNWADDYKMVGPIFVVAAKQTGSLNILDDVSKIMVEYTIEALIGDIALESLNDGYEITMTISIKIVKFGLEFNVGCRGSIVRNGNIITVEIELFGNYIIEVKVPKHSDYGLIAHILDFAKKLNIEFDMTIEANGKIVVQYDLNSKEWSSIGFSCGFSVEWMFLEVDYLRLICASVQAMIGFPLAQIYDAMNYASGYVLSERVTGALGIKISVDFLFSTLKSSVKLTTEFLMNLLQISFDNDDAKELTMSVTPEVSTELYKDDTGTHLEMTGGVKFNFVLDDLPKYVLWFLSILQIADLEYEFYLIGPFDIVKVLNLNNQIDSDKDGLSDYDEENGVHGKITDPMLIDTDGDTLTDYEELFDYKTDPTSPDTDGDSIRDDEEIYGIDYQVPTGCDAPVVITQKSDPTKRDSDGDGLYDDQEIFIYHTDPMNPDMDSDGLSDYEEIMGYYKIEERDIYTSLPNAIDSDNDGISDWWESIHWGSNPMDSNDKPITDNDNDLLDDTWEEQNGLDPTNSTDAIDDNDNDSAENWEEFLLMNTSASDTDTDADGLDDMWEYNYSFDPVGTNDSGLDPDADGLTNIIEYNLGTNPTIADCDQDGLSDGDEVNIYNTDPLNSDSDFDSLDDYSEIIIYQTDATNPDSDSDGILDGEEVVLGVDNYITNPLSADSDGDGIDDLEETTIGADGYITDPTKSDTDGDGIDDLEEMTVGADG
ncbi:MAG: hypothetical protein K9W42_08795, partial [Candidatus Heimdallarchaeota archaeon]|nr:hypothetical protein [Candidatus Heimdallarchaeota archaeon]